MAFRIGQLCWEHNSYHPSRKVTVAGKPDYGLLGLTWVTDERGTEYRVITDNLEPIDEAAPTYEDGFYHACDTIAREAELLAKDHSNMHLTSVDAAIQNAKLAFLKEAL